MTYLQVSCLNHHLSLNSEARADITWWCDFLPSWNGVEYIQPSPITSHTLRLFSDASNRGFGAVYHSHWFSEPWPSSFHQHHINYLELFAVVAAVFTWGHHWANQQILIFTDNMCITNIWKTVSCRDKDMMRLIRALFLSTAKYNVKILMNIFLVLPMFLQIAFLVYR